jgi:hypothetical protein
LLLLPLLLLVSLTQMMLQQSAAGALRDTETGMWMQ